MFICYRRDDSPHAAGRLRDAVADSFGDDKVFMDVENVSGGTDFVNAIAAALSSSTSALVVIGPNWLEARDANGRRRLDDPSDYTRAEIRSALRRGHHVIPVLVDGAFMPTAEQLPPDIAALSRQQAVEISVSKWRSSIAEVTRLIETRNAPRDDLRRRWRFALALAVAAELLAGVAGANVVGTEPREFVIDARDGLDHLPTLNDPPTVKQSTAVKSARACTNSYLGYTVLVPDGLYASGPDDEPFVSCESFDFVPVDNSRYAAEDVLTVPIMFSASARSVDALLGSQQSSNRLAVRIAGQPAWSLEATESGEVPSHTYSVIVPNRETNLLAQLALPISRGATNWAGAKTLMNQLVNSLRLLDARDCSQSTLWHCGEFYWTETPINSRGTSAWITPTVLDAEVGKTVTVRFRVDDAETSAFETSFESWGDSPAARPLALTDGESLYDIIRRRPRDPNEFGPWPPPALRPGGAIFACFHRYAKPGTYKIEFNVRTNGEGADVPRHHDPFAESFSLSATVNVRERGQETTSESIGSTTTTSSPTTIPVLRGSSCRQQPQPAG